MYGLSCYFERTSHFQQPRSNSYRTDSSFRSSSNNSRFLVILMILVTLATLNTLVILVFLVNIQKVGHHPFLIPHFRQTIIIAKIAKIAIILRLNDLLPHTLTMVNVLLPLVPLKINHLKLLPQYRRLFLLLPLLLVISI